MESPEMPTTSTLKQLNGDLADKLLREARDNPHCVYAGKFVGIANGQVVAVADNWDDLARLLRQAEPDPAKTLCLEVGQDYDEVQEIWGLR